MLQSFLGRFDHSGLRSLRIEPEYDERPAVLTETPGGFWAVVDSDELPTIHRALIAGQRQAALQLLIDCAVCRTDRLLTESVRMTGLGRRFLNGRFLPT